MGQTMSLPTILDAAFAPDGGIRPEPLASFLRVTRQQLATAAGLSRDAVSKTARAQAPTTQARLRDMVEILNRVQGWAGSPPMALAWYRSQPLPAFGDQTAEQLVKQGQAEAVKQYLGAIAAGGFA